MKNLLLLLCSLLLNGVFGDTEVKVSVKEGDSVTLKIKPEDINGASTLVWKKMNDKTDIIGILTVKLKQSKVFDTSDNIFGDRLKLNNQTGSLTITNIRSEHSGLYHLEIKGNKENIKRFNVSVSGVFGDTDDVKVSVKEGDSVTLKIKPEDINRAEDLVWRFKDRIIAQIDLEVKDTQPKYTDDEIFRDRLNLERQNGSLTITNIRSEHSGEYKLEITSKGKPKYKTFRVSVSDELIKVSLMEGDSVTLQTGVTGKIDDVKWKFNGDVISDLTDSNHEVNRQTGDLNITNIRRSGEYRVKINGEGFISHETYSVTIIEVIKVSVMEGDSFTLQTGVTGGQIDDVKWKFNGADLTDSRSTNHEVNHRTRDLKIINIRRDQSGDYKVEINGRGFILHKTYSVKISDEVKSESVMEGDDVTLHTDATRIKTEDVIEWKFKESLIAYSNTTTPTDRFDMNLAGSLRITNIRSEDSGLYDVYITGSKIIHKRFKVTVTGSYWIIIVAVLSGVLLLVVVLYVIYKCFRKKKSTHVPSGSDLPLKYDEE